MTIEVTSVPDRRRPLSLHRCALLIRRFRKKARPRSQRVLLRILAAILVLGSVIACDALLRSYQYHSRLIDARLAGGYLISRPGLYAAPRTIRVGQGISFDDLVNVLRRAGYVENGKSPVWSGTFRRYDSSPATR